MMNRRRTTSTAAAVTALLALTAGCGSNSDTTTPPPATSTSSTPSSTPTPQTPEEKASADAQAMVRSYFKTKDSIAQGKAPLGKLKRVSTSTLLNAENIELGRMRDQGQHIAGNVVITKTDVQLVNLNAKVPIVQIDVCWDSSGVKVLDKSGKVINSGQRTRVATTRYTVANYSWKTDKRGGWRVSNAVDQEVGSCTL